MVGLGPKDSDPPCALSRCIYKGYRVCNANLDHVTWPRVQTLGWHIIIAIAG
jgi:hypothetical protein